MPRFYGQIGYGVPQETFEGSGIFEDAIRVREAQGDAVYVTTRNDSSDELNTDVKTTLQVSIVADAYALEHFMWIRFVEWAGHLWVVESSQLKVPRIVLNAGGVYNGPKA